MIKKKERRTENEDLWRRGRCGRTRSRGSPGSYRSACRRCCLRSPCATSLGVFQGASLPFASTCSSPLSRRTWASPRHYYYCYCYYYCRHENDEAKKKEYSSTLLPVRLPSSLTLALFHSRERSMGIRNDSPKGHQLFVILFQRPKFLKRLPAK